MKYCHVWKHLTSSLHVVGSSQSEKLGEGIEIKRA